VFTLLCLFIIPIDILSVSTTSDSAGNQLLPADVIVQRSDNVRDVYYSLYVTVLVFAFGVIPFTYFYYEEFDEDITVKERIWAGFKYTIGLLIIVTVLMIIGAFVKPGNIPQSSDARAWFNYVVDGQNQGEGAITFAIACLTVLGFGVWITYTAYGLSSLPIGLLKGRRHIAEESSDIHGDLHETREQSRAISSKYMTGKRMSEKDQKQLELLKRQERVLAKRSERLNSTQQGFQRVISACKPFSFVFGIVFILVTLLIVISVVLTNIDKIQNSCGPPCGFITKYPKVANPIDLLLWNLAPYFPLDYIVLGSIILYVFACTLNGIIGIGIRFLWVHLFTIRPRQTPPQGLLLATVLLMLALLSLNVEILTLAPRYASYGTQVYFNGNTTLPCSITAPPEKCTMTQIGALMARIQVGTAFFGNVYYYASWVFIAGFLIGVIVSIVKRKSSNIDSQENDSDEEEN